MTAGTGVRLKSNVEALQQRGAGIIFMESVALDQLAASIDREFSEACYAIADCVGRVVVTGIGKSGHIARKWVATFAATGTPSLYIHPGEAAHGDLGMLARGDILIILSNSGNSSELRPLIQYAEKIGVKIVGVASQIKSAVMNAATIKLLLPKAREACPSDFAPTTSSAMQLAIGDALALTVMELRGFPLAEMQELHPGGSLGLRLLTVRELMHGANAVPLVHADAPMRDVILSMTSKGFGLAGVVDCAGRLVGAITDGDLRRHFEDLTSATAKEIMTVDPKVLGANMPAEDALRCLNENQITGAFVMEEGAAVNTNVPIGIVHIHDFIRFEAR